MSEYFEIQLNKRHFDSTTSNYFERAPRSFNKHDPKDRHRALELFKDIIGASLDLALKDKSCYHDENFLFRFLHARNYQLEEAKLLLIHYMLFKEQHRSLLQKMNIFDEKIKLALRDGNPRILRERDRRGRTIITFIAANWDTSKYELEDVFRAFLLSLDKMLEDIQNQELGFVVIVDWTNFSYKQSAHLSPRILKLMIEGLQDCTPAKFKGIHFIAEPWYVNVALTVIKPLLQDKIKKRFVLHGTNLSTLHNLINKDVLPPDLGGEGQNVSTLDWYHYLVESSQSSDCSKTYRLIENDVYSTTKSSLDIDSKEKPLNS